ncbi:MAG TPA: hypothetical protein RMH99_30940, partial [Sandaracinaceae bacterium LLY-WYZ-13_1]|nr:hypothetical protein [Sandaracinaceae bacterium LLY-WYZ-13_1]
MHQLTTHLRHLVLAVALVATGCVGGPADAGQTGGSLLEVPPDTTPLLGLEDDAWRHAPPSCEGQLAHGDLDFRLASATDGLVAAVDRSGDVICVDSVESVQEELEEEGREEAAHELGDSFLVAVGLAYVPSADSLAAGDPSPQPSIQGMDTSAGSRHTDPSPQPSTQANQN